MNGSNSFRFSILFITTLILTSGCIQSDPSQAQQGIRSSDMCFDSDFFLGSLQSSNDTPITFRGQIINEYRFIPGIEGGPPTWIGGVAVPNEDVRKKVSKLNGKPVVFWAEYCSAPMWEIKEDNPENVIFKELASPSIGYLYLTDVKSAVLQEERGPLLIEAPQNIGMDENPHINVTFQNTFDDVFEEVYIGFFSHDSWGLFLGEHSEKRLTGLEPSDRISWNNTVMFRYHKDKQWAKYGVHTFGVYYKGYFKRGDELIGVYGVVNVSYSHEGKLLTKEDAEKTGGE
ncbi:MAG: hypothetical protein ABH950_03805 [Candidatus Altiarchaeota archaeon]